MNIRDMVFEELAGYFMKEDYPASFNHEEFANLRTFAERVRYCAQHLKKIGAGSARIVYEIDDRSVLKLAKNAKGIAQNELEASLSNDYYIRDMVAQIFKSHPNDEWIEAEYAKRVTPTRFRELTGIDIKTLSEYLWKKHAENKGRGMGTHLSPEQLEMVENNEFANNILDIMLNYDMPSGDLGRISSYGEVNRNGQPEVVIIDYGLNDDVYQDHYAPKQKASFSRY